jgi:tRNA (uracil-5-)-methyltransferase
MLSYETQLDLKRKVVVNAYQNYSSSPPVTFLPRSNDNALSDIPESSIPSIQPTIPSPLQYGYRTKITPHFDPPPKKLQNQPPTSSEEEKPSWLKIGFNHIGKRVVMDIEV